MVRFIDILSSDGLIDLKEDCTFSQVSLWGCELRVATAQMLSVYLCIYLIVCHRGCKKIGAPNG